MNNPIDLTPYLLKISVLESRLETINRFFKPTTRLELDKARQEYQDAMEHNDALAFYRQAQQHAVAHQMTVEEWMERAANLFNSTQFENEQADKREQFLRGLGDRE